MKNLRPKAILMAMMFSVALLTALSAPSEAARKAKGEVAASIKAGGDLCKAMQGLLKKAEECKAEDMAAGAPVVLIQSEKKIFVKKDQPVILKAKDAGKTTGKVIQVFDLPIEPGTLKEMVKDKNSVVLWQSEKDGKLVVIQPEKDFLPEKGQQVKLKVKGESVKVEGC